MGYWDEWDDEGADKPLHSSKSTKQSKSWNGYGYGNSYSSNYNKGGYTSSKNNAFTYKSLYDWGDWGIGADSLSEKYLAVKAHENYMTPSRTEIEMKYLSVNGKTFRGTYLDVEKIQEYSRYFYHELVENPDYMKSPSEISYGKGWLDSKEAFYKDLKDTDIPGYTPLERAIHLYVKTSPEKDTKGKKITREESEAGDEEELANLLSSGIEFDKDWWDTDLNDLFEANYKNRKMNVLNKISLLKELGAKFEIEKEVTETIVANSNKFKKKMLRDYSQLPMIELYQRLMPNYQHKLITKDLVFNAPININENKQKIIILLDYSGSMSSGDKQDWVVTILADRLRYVMKGEAEIFFSYYLYEISFLNFTHIHDRDSALEFWKKFSTSPSGGDTAIGKMINHIAQEIPQKKLHNLDIDLSKEKPEVLIIHDGQDSVKTSHFDYKSNAITMLDGVNEELKKVCIETKGMYVYIPSGEIGHNNPIKAYEENFERLLN